MLGERGKRSIDILSWVVKGPLVLVKKYLEVVLLQKSLAKEANLLDLRT